MTQQRSQAEGVGGELPLDGDSPGSDGPRTAVPAAQPAPARRPGTWVALGLLVLIGVAAVLPLRTPAPRPLPDHGTSFVADRALADLGRIAAAPHATGMATQPQVRDYLVDRLRGLGLQPQVITRVAQAPAQFAALGRTADIWARIPGSRPTGTVLLVAHYDSVPTGPGASDDGAGVAAILEIARALLAGPAPRNDVDILLTDGEEAGMLGAQAFVDSRFYADPTRVVAINLEARGVSGPVVMFESAGTGLVPAIRASGAVATSAADVVYRILGNGTDLTAFRRAGMRGLNFAFFGDAARYHTAHDDLASVSAGSVQDLGDAALAATRSLAADDLGTHGAGATYFGVFGAVVAYPNGLVLPLAVLALIGVVSLLWWGRRRGLSVRRVSRAALTFPLVLLVAPTVIWQAGWMGLLAIRPNAGLSFGHVSGPAYPLAELALLLVVVIAWYRWARRRAGLADVATAVIGWFALLGVVLALLAPMAAYLATWPAVIGVVVTAVALRRGRAEALSPAVALGAVAVPATVLLLPVCVLLVPALGPGLAGYLLMAAALLGAAQVGVAELLPRRRATTAGLLAAALVAVGTFAAAAALDRPSPGAPQPVSLGYVLDADTGTAHWISDGDSRQPLVGSLLTEPPRRLDEQWPLLGGYPIRSGPAPVAAAAGSPQTDAVTATEQDGVRTVRVRLRAPADAYQLAVFVDTRSHQVLEATVDGARLSTEAQWPDANGGWRWGFVYVAVPADGVDLVLLVRGSGPVPVRLLAAAAGLPAGVGAPTLPAHLHWVRFPSLAGQSFVARTVHF